MESSSRLPAAGVCVVVASRESFAETCGFLVRHGWVTRAVFPADDPRSTTLVGFGVKVTVDHRDCQGAGPAAVPVAIAVLHLPGSPLPCALQKDTALPFNELSPGGVIKLHVYKEPEEAFIPGGAAKFSLSQIMSSGASAWVEGRAGMQYRDLIPCRQSGRYIASHIRIPQGGDEIPDYVHYHKVRFQMIFCVAGWVKVVYESQGEPFILQPGDMVIQPPTIRHRVLASSDGLEVVELSCPAEHITLADVDMTLPTHCGVSEGEVDAGGPALAAASPGSGGPEPKRCKLVPARAATEGSSSTTGSNMGPPDFEWCGQKFVRSRADAATWAAAPDGWERRDCGVHAATAGVASVNVVRRRQGETGASYQLNGHVRTSDAQESDIQFHYVLEGEATLTVMGKGKPQRHSMRKGDAWVVPLDAQDDGTIYSLETVEHPFSMIEVWMSRD